MPLMGGIARIDDELRRAYDGDCWPWPPLRKVLRGVTAATAAGRNPQLVHSIWALVSHFAAWVEVRLGEIVPGKTYPLAVMLHGTAQHHAYHAGQIALLKKLVG
jgi:hypothetical protein